MAAAHVHYDNPVKLYTLEQQPGRWEAGVEPFAVFGSDNTEDRALENTLEALRSRLNEIVPMMLHHESPRWEGSDFERLERLKAEARHVWMCRVVVEATEPDQQRLKIIVQEGELRRGGLPVISEWRKGACPFPSTCSRYGSPCRARSPWSHLGSALRNGPASGR